MLVLGVYYKLQTFIYLTANGIIQGVRPLVGYNYGAGTNGRVKEGNPLYDAGDFVLFPGYLGAADAFSPRGDSPL